MRYALAAAATMVIGCSSGAPSGDWCTAHCGFSSGNVCLWTGDPPFCERIDGYADNADDDASYQWQIACSSCTQRCDDHSTPSCVDTSTSLSWQCANGVAPVCVTR